MDLQKRKLRLKDVRSPTKQATEQGSEPSLKLEECFLALLWGTDVNKRLSLGVPQAILQLPFTFTNVHTLPVVAVVIPLRVRGYFVDTLADVGEKPRTRLFKIALFLLFFVLILT